MAKTRKKSHKALGVMLAILLLFSIASWQSNCRLKTEAFAYASAALPESFDGFRVVQLSDLHGANFGTDNAHLFAAISAAEPDIIVTHRRAALQICDNELYLEEGKLSSKC